MAEISSSESARPSGMPCHLRRQPRQQQPVACWAMKHGWPRHGVCLPSFGMTAGPRRLRMISRHCASMTGNPFSATQASSRLPQTEAASEFRLGEARCDFFVRMHGDGLHIRLCGCILNNSI